MSKITVGIESDALDLIIHQTLVEDYRSLCDEVRRLEKKVELRTFEQEDLISTRKSEYSYSEQAAASYAEDIDIEYFKDLKEKRIEMLEEQVEYLMKAHHSHPPEPTFDGRKIHTDQWGKRYVMNENGIRTYLEPFGD